MDTPFTTPSLSPPRRDKNSPMQKRTNPKPTTLTPSPTKPDSPDPSRKPLPCFFCLSLSLFLSFPCLHYKKARETYTAPAPGTVVRVSRNSLWGSWWQKPTGIPRLTGFWRSSPRGGSRGSCCEL
jgi:hypothetical protein